MKTLISITSDQAKAFEMWKNGKTVELVSHGNKPQFELGFREYLKLSETGTSTADVATFARPVLGQPVTRQWLGAWADEDPFFKRKKKSKLNLEPSHK
jgi:hypothetical protein